jgi:UDPglucose 6-dehydrogenase
MLDEKHFKVGVIGVGMVGTPLVRYLVEIKKYKRGRDIFLFDKDPKKKMNDDVNKADIIFVAVPTPPKEDRFCNTLIVEAAVATIAPGKIVVIKSTVPPGTTEMLQARHPELKMLFNPEFLTESRAWEDMLRPDRQIVGFTAKSLEAASHVLALLPKAAFMSPWGVGTYKQVRITATEAEFIKYAANVYFAMKVNWANALYDASQKLGADYDNVRAGMASDHRIGDSHLDANHGGYRGFGGYCLPKDLDAFLGFAKSQKLDNVAKLLSAARDFNEELLKSQGLTIADVSEHDASLKAKLAKLAKKKNAK